MLGHAIRTSVSVTKEEAMRTKSTAAKAVKAVPRQAGTSKAPDLASRMLFRI